MVWAARGWPAAGLGKAKLSWQSQLVLQGLAGMAVLVGGLWVFGVDGKMATYGACVLVAAALQWVLARGWRR